MTNPTAAATTPITLFLDPRPFVLGSTAEHIDIAALGHTSGPVGRLTNRHDGKSLWWVKVGEQILRGPDGEVARYTTHLAALAAFAAAFAPGRPFTLSG